MKRIIPVFAIAVIGAWCGGASSASAARANPITQNSASASADADASTQGILPAGTIVDATLSTTVDAKKSKPGDRVEARTAQDIKQDGKVVLKKGTRLTGHISEVQARTKDQPQSDLGMVFDHAVPKNGEEMPLGLTIRALAATPSAPSSSDAELGEAAGPSGAPGDGGLLGPSPAVLGATSGAVVNTAASPDGSATGAVTTAGRTSGAIGGLTSSGRLAPNSSGVFGMEGLSLRTVAATSATEGSLIISPGKNVHLDSGTQMLLIVTVQAQ